MSTGTIRLSGKLTTNSYGEAYDILFCGSTAVAEWAYNEVPRDKQVSLRYWITDKEVALEDAQQEATEQLLGKADHRWGARYSEVTGYLWTDEEFHVGGHDMIARLGSFVGKYLHLEVEVAP